MNRLQDSPDMLDAVVVGAGFAGLYSLYRMRDLGLSVRGFEAGPSVGGTWYWNRYPGARCDIESVDYSYSFSEDLQQSWEWTERYATQPEIFEYANHVADRFDLRQLITFNTRIDAAVWDEEIQAWRLTTSTGETVTARYCIMATGVLSSVKEPDFAGIDRFSGQIVQSSRWPSEGLDLEGKRVGVIGTGSTGVQLIPLVAEKSGHLTVFQRTANFSVPARNRKLEADELDRVKATYSERRKASRMAAAGFPEPPSPGSALDYTPEERDAIYEAAWATGGGPSILRAFNDIATNPEANFTAADFVRRKIRETVSDPQVAELLSPEGFALGTKRICVDTGYYATFNRPNVALADVKSDPIDHFTETSLVTKGGTEHRLDVLILAIGFDALTGALLAMNVVGRDGKRLSDHWATRPRNYLGLALAGFPNLFTVVGPGSPSVLGNVLTSIEQHVDFIAGCISHANSTGSVTIETSESAEDSWQEQSEEAAKGLLIADADSWYRGTNIPGKPVALLPYPGGFGRFRKICDEIAIDGYRGFTFTPALANASH